MERKKQPLWFRYGLAVFFIALATLVRIGMYAWGGIGSPRYLSFYPAVIFVTLYAGLYPGLLALALSAVTAFYWIEPVGVLTVKSPVEMIGFLMFVLTNFLVVWICEKMHRATRRAVQAEDARAMAETLNAQAAAVKQSEERYRAIFETAVDGIITIDERGIVESINPAGEKLFGYCAEELVGGNVSRLMPSPDREHHDQYLEHYRRTGVKKIIGIGREVVALRKDGTLFPIRLAVSEAWLGERRIFIGRAHDITERKKMERKLKEANEVALAANASKDQFLATLSHELRTPLTPALMVIAARESDPALSADLREDLATARRNLELEARLIDDLLDLNRVVRGKIPLHLQPQNLHAIIQRARAVCRADFETKEQNIRLELQADGHFIDADAGRLQQVFWNLLRNASKFTPQGGSIAIRSSNPNPGTVRVEIVDTGIGIAPEKIDRLFVPFEQGDMSITRQFGGMGLGLAISKALVDLHNGQIQARSEGEGMGTTFTVELPLTRSQVPVEEAAPLSDAAVRAAQPGARKLRILLVEDHLDTLRILSRLLESHGGIVTAAQTFDAALAAAQTAHQGAGKFDLLISDLGLPDGDGRALMSALRDRYGFPGIALSGYGMEEDVEKSRVAGFREHLTKPVKIAELLQTVERVTGVPMR